MKIIYGSGFTEEEKKDYKIIICNNIVSCIKTIANATIDLNIKLDPITQVLKKK